MTDRLDYRAEAALVLAEYYGVRYINLPDRDALTRVFAILLESAGIAETPGAEMYTVCEQAAIAFDRQIDGQLEVHARMIGNACRLAEKAATLK